MDTQQAVASMDDRALTVLASPMLLRAALEANERLELYLRVLQASLVHARSPREPALDLSHEIAAVDLGEPDRADWLRDLPGSATWRNETLQAPDLLRLVDGLRKALTATAQPLVEGPDADPELAARVGHWQDELVALAGAALPAAAMAALTDSRRSNGDSLCITVMDLHKALIRRSAAPPLRPATASPAPVEGRLPLTVAIL